MLLVNNNPHKLTKEEFKEYSQEHIWTVPKRFISWDAVNKKIQVPLRWGIPSEYRAPMQIGTDKSKNNYIVRYVTASRPDPASAHRDIHEPQFVEIEKGVLLSEDPDLNFFLYHNPYTRGGKNFKPDSKAGTLCNLYKRQEYVNRIQTKATRLLRVISKIQAMNETDLIAAAKSAIHLAPTQNFLRINEQRLADAETREEELMNISAGLLEYATKLPDTVENILSRDEATLFKYIQAALDADSLTFDGETPQAGTAGIWKLQTKDGSQDLVVVPDNKPKMDYLFTFLHNPKNEKKRLLLTDSVKELETA